MTNSKPTPNPTAPESSIILYQTEDGRTRIDCRFENETIWLSQALMAELFQSSKQNLSLHIQNILDEGELQEDSVVKEYLTTAADGKQYSTKHYALPLIIAVGYRVRSPRGTQFRQWATARLSEFLVKGFTMDDVRTGRQMNWLGLSNGKLLDAAAEFDLFITVDKNLVKQQSLDGRHLAVVVLRAKSNKIDDISPLVPGVIAILVDLKPGTVSIVS